MPQEKGTKDSGHHVHGPDGSPPESLSEHVGESLAALRDKVEGFATKAKNVAGNMTGSREVGKIGRDLAGQGD